MKYMASARAQLIFICSNAVTNLTLRTRLSQKKVQLGKDYHNKQDQKRNPKISQSQSHQLVFQLPQGLDAKVNVWKIGSSTDQTDPHLLTLIYRECAIKAQKATP